MPILGFLSKQGQICNKWQFEEEEPENPFDCEVSYKSLIKAVPRFCSQFTAFSLLEWLKIRSAVLRACTGKWTARNTENDGATLLDFFKFSLTLFVDIEYFVLNNICLKIYFTIGAVFWMGWQLLPNKIEKWREIRILFTIYLCAKFEWVNSYYQKIVKWREIQILFIWYLARILNGLTAVTKKS